MLPRSCHRYSHCRLLDSPRAAWLGLVSGGGGAVGRWCSPENSPSRPAADVTLPTGHIVSLRFEQRCWLVDEVS